MNNLIQKYNIDLPSLYKLSNCSVWYTMILLNKVGLKLFNDLSMKAMQKNISIYIHLPYCELLCTFVHVTNVLRNSIEEFVY